MHDSYTHIMVITPKPLTKIHKTFILTDSEIKCKQTEICS